MRILFLTDGFPYPLVSGRLRQFHFMQQLAKRHRITLLSVVPPGHVHSYHSALEPYTERIETIACRQLSRSLLEKLNGRALARLSRGCVGARAEMARRIHRLHADERFDVVINARVDWPKHQQLPGVPVVADQCDAVSAALAMQLRVAPWEERLSVVAKLMKTRHDEARMLRSCDHLIVASARDRNAFVQQHAAVAALPATILPNGVDTGYWRRQSRVRPRDIIVFNGSMLHPPNDDAAQYLIERILPLVRCSRPEARIRVVGRRPSAHLRDLAARTPGVELTGYVDDMRPHLEDATIAAVPLRFASGVQNKILEAMAMEVPVVTTPIAAVALRDARGQPPPVLVADGEESLARAIVDRLVAADRDPGPDTVARRWVAREFDWVAVGDQLHEVICGVVERRVAAALPATLPASGRLALSS